MHRIQSGRSGFIASGGLVSPTPTRSERWDQFFKTEFLRVSYDHSQDYPSESACAFGSTQHPML
jgi:hypothetical protein